MTNPIISIKNLSFTYYRSETKALDDINLDIEQGSFVVITGPTGSGKTTLCLCLNSIIPNFVQGSLSGDIFIKGQNTGNSDVDELSETIGIVLQDPDSQLFSTSIQSELAFGPENLGLPREEIKERLKWALHVTRLQGLEGRSPTDLSGGQKQRVAVGAALTMRPEVLILDEPTSELDPVGTKEVFAVIKELNQAYGITIIMVEHKSDEIAEFADRLIVLKDGRILADGAPRDVLSDVALSQKAFFKIPEVMQVALALEQNGLKLPVCPVSVQEAYEEIEKCLRKEVG